MDANFPESDDLPDHEPLIQKSRITTYTKFPKKTPKKELIIKSNKKKVQSSTFREYVNRSGRDSRESSKDVYIQRRLFNVQRANSSIPFTVLDPKDNLKGQ